jgi:hypothetical protein
MESFFGTLKTELVHQRDYPDHNTARRDLFAYIKGYYNRRRIHSALSYITPEQADRKTAQPGVHFSGKVKRGNAWILENRCLALRYDRIGFIIQSLRQATCIFPVAPRFAREV